MDFTIPEELTEIRTAVRELCERFPGEYWRALEPDKYPEEFVAALTENGWLAALVPEEYGGAGLSLTAASVILEEINATGGNSGACHAQMYIMGTILRHGSEEQKERYLPKIASGDLRLQAFGVTEPTAGSDTTKIQTTAERVNGGYVIRGQKIWTSRAMYSDLMLLLARTTPVDEVEKKTEGLSTFIVDMKAALEAGTMTIRPIKTLMNHATTEIFLDGVEVPEENLVGVEGKGFRYVLDGMNAERVLIAAECIGDGRWFTEKATAYASERVVFGRPIGANQGVQFPIAQAHAQIEAARSHALQGGVALRAGPSLRRRGEHGKAPRSGSLMAGCERVPRRPRRLRLRRGVRRRAQVPRDAPLQGRARLEQPHPRLRRPARPRHAPVVLGGIAAGRRKADGRYPPWSAGGAGAVTGKPAKPARSGRAEGARPRSPAGKAGDTPQARRSRRAADAPKAPGREVQPAKPAYPARRLRLRATPGGLAEPLRGQLGRSRSSARMRSSPKHCEHRDPDHRGQHPEALERGKALAVDEQPPDDRDDRVLGGEDSGDRNPVLCAEKKERVPTEVEGRCRNHPGDQRSWEKKRTR